MAVWQPSQQEKKIQYLFQILNKMVGLLRNNCIKLIPLLTSTGFIKPSDLKILSDSIDGNIHAIRFIQVIL